MASGGSNSACLAWVAAAAEAGIALERLALVPDLRLAITASRWEGLGHGSGRLEARRIEVVADGRGTAAKERRATLWLPGPTVVGAGRISRGTSGTSAR